MAKFVKMTGKKRSYSGTFLYCVAIVVKLVAIATSYWLISGEEWFLDWTGMEMDLAEHGIGTLYLGSLLMSLQVGILAYSLTHDYYMTGKPGHRQLAKAAVFLWSPIQALFVWFRDYGYWMMSWEYGLMVLVDVLILVGCACKSGSSWANKLRPYKERKSGKHRHHRHHRDVESHGHRHHHKHDSSDSDSTSDSDSDSESSSSSDSEAERCRCPVHPQSKHHPVASPASDRPKIRVDGQ